MFSYATSENSYLCTIFINPKFGLYETFDSFAPDGTFGLLHECSRTDGNLQCTEGGAAVVTMDTCTDMDGAGDDFQHWAALCRC